MLLIAWHVWPLLEQLCRVLIGNVKVSAPAKLLQQQKSAEKRERKERAKEREGSAREKEEAAAAAGVADG